MTNRDVQQTWKCMTTPTTTMSCPCVLPDHSTSGPSHALPSTYLSPTSKLTHSTSAGSSGLDMKVRIFIIYAPVNVNHQGSPTSRLRGFRHFKISSVKVLTLICTFCVRIPSISYPRRWESLYFKCQNCPWV